MAKITPFQAIRPVPEKAAEIASPPYDVINSAEARIMAKGNPLSFLHVVKSEIDLPEDIDPHDDIVYATAKANFEQLVAGGHMFRESSPCFYLYRQIMRIGDRDHCQTGVVAGVSVLEYEQNLIKKHELTRADKEADRTRHVETLNANSGPVFLTYRATDTINTLVDERTAQTPVYDFVANDGIRHSVWIVSDEPGITALTRAFATLPTMYIADGHHRSASSVTVGKRKRLANPNNTGNEEYNFFMAVMFPDDQLYIMDYNRYVCDLNGLAEADFLANVSNAFTVTQTNSPRPTRATEFGMYLGGKWYRLSAIGGTFDPTDPVNCLDVAILQKNLLSPILGIGDPRTDQRIDFIGGIRGMGELERRVNESGGVAFSMYATSMDQLMAIADAGQIMPPKSTWFEPKLRSGLLVRTLD